MGGSAAGRARAALLSTTAIFVAALGLWSVAVFQTSEASPQGETSDTLPTQESSGTAELANGTVVIEPITGTAPQAISVRCQTKETVTIDFGDGSNVLAVDCPATVGHRVTSPGIYSVVVKQAGQELGTQQIMVSAGTTSATNNGFSTGQLLLLSLIGAGVLSLLVSYLIIRPPLGRHAW